MEKRPQVNSDAVMAITEKRWKQPYSCVHQRFGNRINSVCKHLVNNTLSTFLTSTIKLYW